MLILRSGTSSSDKGLYYGQACPECEAGIHPGVKARSNLPLPSTGLVMREGTKAENSEETQCRKGNNMKSSTQKVIQAYTQSKVS